MSYRLFALDIDGTIRTEDYPLSQRTMEIITHIRSLGAIVTVATGRMFDSASRACAELNLDCPIISFQGAQVSDPTTGRILWQRQLTIDMFTSTLKFLESQAVEVLVYKNNQIYVTSVSPWIEKYVRRNHAQLEVVKDFKFIDAEYLTRIVVVGKDTDIGEIEVDMKAMFDSKLYVTRSLPQFCEILHPEGGKEKALAWLCTHFGIDQHETVAFGNGYNDIGMLEWAQLGIAIEGSPPEVLAVADNIAPPVSEEGVASVLEELVTKGLVG